MRSVYMMLKCLEILNYVVENVLAIWPAPAPPAMKVINEKIKACQWRTRVNDAPFKGGHAVLSMKE